ncbi:MAG: PD-(D/E)XK nuclease family protein [candidate division WS1 bacterium]|jgi:hypothetical protein|nr:PD-(D/E)XK nuclease family protein [candidate division WS1 bacterium]
MSDERDNAPVPVVPLDLPERPFTARNIADFHECPQKFLLSWFVPREETRRFLGGPATLHQALRAALVDCHRLGGPSAAPLVRVQAVFEDAWDGSACADSLEEEQLHTQGLRMLRDYHEAHMSGPATVDVDVRMEIPLGDHRFVAVADAVMRLDDGGLSATRWMSTRNPPSAQQLGESPAWALLYACMQDRYPGEDLSVTMWSLRRSSGHRISFFEDDLQPLLRRLTRVADRIRVATVFPAETGMHCRWCRARSRCPALR